MANKTLKTLLDRIAAYTFVNSAIPLHDKMCLVMEPADVFDIGLYKDNNQYRFAAHDKVESLSGMPEDETLDNFLHEGDFSGGAVTLETLADEWREFLKQADNN